MSQKNLWKADIQNAKIIFLDVDGVLNHQLFYNNRAESIAQKKWDKEEDISNFCPDSIALLNELTDTTGALIVLSAGMRFDHNLDGLQELFKRAGLTGTIISTTPSFLSVSLKVNGSESGYTVPRGVEIDWWLREHGYRRITWDEQKQKNIFCKSAIKNYVIIDDDADMLYSQKEHFVKTNAYKGGLDKQAFVKAVKILCSDPMDLYQGSFDL